MPAPIPIGPADMDDILSHVVPLGKVLAMLQVLTTAVIIPACIMLVKRLGDIRSHLARLNGNVAEINQWRADHDKQAQSEERTHESMHEKCAALHQERIINVQDRLNNINQQLTQLWGRVGDRRHGVDRTD